MTTGLKRLSLLAAPALGLPLRHPVADPLADILAVGHQLDLAAALQAGQPLDGAGQLHPVVGRGGLGARGVDDPAAGRVLEDVGPAAGAGVAAAGAVGEEADEVGGGRGVGRHP